MALILSPDMPSTGALSVFRAVRLLRIFRLARSWKSLNRIVTILLDSLAAVFWLTALLFLYLFITGLLGMTVGMTSGNGGVTVGMKMCVEDE